ncbi:glycine zipper 2TM domain-containing protein [Terrihabitans sp. B22-R8]|uniref:glycine zipper 2TM domain-containing protein n=1 Tax=Terrihabitans sp. B22-R8 TaxID=3425128 RepID=UPI00403CCE60
MIGRKFLMVAVLTTSVAACNQTTGDAGPREGVGTVAGAVAGGLLGSTIGHGSGRAVATLAGAAVGGLVGNQIGRSMDDNARREAYDAEIRALEYGAPGAPVAWRSDAYYGTVTPGPYAERGGYERCREYAHTVYVDGSPRTARGIACRQPDGRWSPV